MKKEFKAWWSTQDGFNFEYGNARLWKVKDGFMVALNREGMYYDNKKSSYLEDALEDMLERGA